MNLSSTNRAAHLNRIRNFWQGRPGLTDRIIPSDCVRWPSSGTSPDCSSTPTPPSARRHRLRRVPRRLRGSPRPVDLSLRGRGPALARPDGHRRPLRLPAPGCRPARGQAPPLHRGGSEGWAADLFSRSPRPWVRDPPVGRRGPDVLGRQPAGTDDALAPAKQLADHPARDEKVTPRWPYGTDYSLRAMGGPLNRADVPSSARSNRIAGPGHAPDTKDRRRAIRELRSPSAGS